MPLYRPNPSDRSIVRNASCKLLGDGAEDCFVDPTCACFGVSRDTLVRLILSGPFFGFRSRCETLDFFFFGFEYGEVDELVFLALSFLEGVRSPGIILGPPRERASGVLAFAHHWPFSWPYRDPWRQALHQENSH